jgi:hypothetical protein
MTPKTGTIASQCPITHAECFQEKYTALAADTTISNAKSAWAQGSLYIKPPSTRAHTPTIAWVRAARSTPFFGAGPTEASLKMNSSSLKGGAE